MKNFRIGKWCFRCWILSLLGIVLAGTYQSGYAEVHDQTYKTILEKCTGVELIDEIEEGMVLLSDGEDAVSGEEIMYEDDPTWEEILYDAGAQLRAGMLEHRSPVYVYLNAGTSALSGDIYNLGQVLIEEAVKYTGKANEGDYISYQISYWSVDIDPRASYTTLKYYITYETTLEEEEFVDLKVKEILSSLNLEEKTHFKKICAIYEWVCQNISYSIEGKHNTTYKALSTYECACMGFDTLLYRLMNQAGIECHILDGYAGAYEYYQGYANHTWNIIKIDDLFYLADVTWDHGEPSVESCSWFLHGSNDWEEHYYTNEKYKSYNISEENYFAGGEITCKLSSVRTGNEIEALEYTFGSYSWIGETEDDFSSLYLELEMPNPTNITERSFQVTLPEGFSFDSDMVTSVKSLTFLRNSGKLYTKKEIYPLYSNSYNRKPEIRVKQGAEDDVFVIPVEKNSSEGLIKMRPTAKVNGGNEDEPFENTIKIYPIADLYNQPVTEYSDSLAGMCCTLTQAVYNENGRENESDAYIADSFHNLGFSRFKWYNPLSDHLVSAGFAQKKIIVNGTIYNTVVCAVRGTVGTEWIGNFNINGTDENVHADFKACADNILTVLDKYCSGNSVDKSNTRLILCGHSRGGAVVDLVAHDLNVQNNGFRDITAYTFAAPNSVKNPDVTAKDDNIFNYVYKYDIVGYLPGNDYGKYGNTFVVGGTDQKNAPDAVRTAFAKNTVDKYYENIGSKEWASAAVKAYYFWSNGLDKGAGILKNWLGKKIADPESVKDWWLARGHCGENYCAWVQGICIRDAIRLKYADTMSNHLTTECMRISTAADVAVTSAFLAGSATRAYVNVLGAKNKAQAIIQVSRILYEDGSKLIGIKCPVDIIVRGKDGNEMAHYTNHTEISVDDLFLSDTDGTADYFVLPDDSEYTFEITATADGSMSIDCLQMNEFGECEKAESVHDIPLQIGEKYTLFVDVGREHPLVLVSTGGEQYPLGKIWEDDMLQIPAGTTIIEDQAFYGTGMRSVIIPENVHTIGDMAFGACQNLETVIFTNGDNIDFNENMIKNSPSARIIAPEGSVIYEWALEKGLLKY